MTMLDRMRRHKAWLKWSLAIVVGAFILLYVPSFLSPQGAGTAPSDVIATIEGRSITVAKYQLVYQQQITQMRSAYGGELTDDLLRQLGISQQVVQQLIDEEAILVEADRLGVEVNDGELRSRILKVPGFQENGRFIGDARYRQILAAQRPPMRPAEFEAELRRALMAEKLEAAVTGWMQISNDEVETEYRRRNERVKLDLAVFTADAFRSGVDPSDEQLQAYFTENIETYRVPEKRRVRYLSIDADVLQTTMTATEAEVQARYNQNQQTYTTPEQIRASHILFSTEGQDVEAVRAEAEAVLARARAGEDFAALARQYSDDEVSRSMDGDLDFFGRGAMVREFEDAAFALQVGEISDLVQTQYGFHIIKVTDRRPAVTRPLDEVRGQIEDQIKYEKAAAEASRLADEISGEIDSPEDLDRVAAARGLAVGDSGLFSRDEPLAGLGYAPSVAAEAFLMEVGDVSEMLATTQGYAFITLTEIEPSALPALDDVRDQVREDVITSQALELARSRAARMSASVSGGTSFAGAARTAGVEVQTTDLVTRGSVLPAVGMSSAVDDAVFALEQGATTSPIETPDAIVVARVTERGEIDQEALEAARQGLRAQLLQQRRGDFFSAYMTKAKQAMRIELNDNTLRAILER